MEGFPNVEVPQVRSGTRYMQAGGGVHSPGTLMEVSLDGWIHEVKWTAAGG